MLKLPATEACLSRIIDGLKVNDRGEIIFSDVHNNRIRKIELDGSIHTIAGNGICGFNGNNKIASKTSLCEPRDVYICKSGEIYFVDSCNRKIRKIESDSTITDVFDIPQIENGQISPIILCVNDERICYSIKENDIPIIIIVDNQNEQISGTKILERLSLDKKRNMNGNIYWNLMMDEYYDRIIYCESDIKFTGMQLLKSKKEICICDGRTFYVKLYNPPDKFQNAFTLESCTTEDRIFNIVGDGFNFNSKVDGTYPYITSFYVHDNFIYYAVNDGIIFKLDMLTNKNYHIAGIPRKNKYNGDSIPYPHTERLNISMNNYNMNILRNSFPWLYCVYNKKHEFPLIENEIENLVKYVRCEISHTQILNNNSSNLVKYLVALSINTDLPEEIPRSLYLISHIVERIIDMITGVNNLDFFNDVITNCSIYKDLTGKFANQIVTIREYCIGRVIEMTSKDESEYLNIRVLPSKKELVKWKPVFEHDEFIKRAYSDQSISDIIFKTKNEILYGHTMILSKATIIEAMLNSGNEFKDFYLSEKKDKYVFEIENSYEIGMKYLFDYCYGIEPKKTEYIENVIECANSNELYGLTRNIFKSIELNNFEFIRFTRLIAPDIEELSNVVSTLIDYYLNNSKEVKKFLNKDWLKALKIIKSKKRKGSDVGIYKTIAVSKKRNLEHPHKF